MLTVSRKLLSTVLFLIIGAGLSSAEPQRYQFIDLSAAGGQRTSNVYDFNSSGVSAGYIAAGSNFRAATWGPAGLQVLDRSTENSFAFSINDRGQTVGRLGNQPALWENGNVGRYLKTPDEAPGVAFKINNHGWTVGSYLHNQRETAALWIGDVMPYPLGALSADAISAAISVNDSGLIVGNSQVPCLDKSLLLRGFVWTGGHMFDLGAPAGMATSLAADVNDRGQIAATAIVDASDCQLYATEARAALFENGKWTVLPDLSKYSGSQALSINKHGAIVGSLFSFFGEPVSSFLFQDGQIYDLKDLIDDLNPEHQLLAGQVIDDEGRIAGRFVDNSFWIYAERAYLLVPKPTR